MVALSRHHGNLDDHRAIMEVMHSGGGTLRKSLDMYGSPHLTIPYLLRGEHGDLENKS